MGQSTHYFIGLPIPEEIARLLAEKQNILKGQLDYKQWPGKEDFHITLKFLGAVDTETLAKIQGVLSSLMTHSSFSCNVNGIGTFGKEGSPRVLWAGVELSQPLKDLQDEIEEAAATCGFPRENRPYRPHITLGKKWNGPADRDRLQAALDAAAIQPMTFKADHFVLYEIRPGQTPKYRVVASYALKEE